MGYYFMVSIGLSFIVYSWLRLLNPVRVHYGVVNHHEARHRRGITRGTSVNYSVRSEPVNSYDVPRWRRC